MPDVVPAPSALEAANAPAVRVVGVSKRVRDGESRRAVLSDVSFEVARGELVVLRGPSGSGKSTLLAIVGGMLSPTSGEVYLDGEATSRLREAHRADVRRKKVGFVFQDLQLLDAMTAIDNVLLPRVPEGIRREDEARALTLLTRFGVERSAHTPVRSLSGGERQRVALARALLFDPPLVVMDEPTAHLDDARTHALATELSAIVGEGRAVLVASHDARIVGLPGARVVTLEDGRVVGGPSPEAEARA
ncbi:MAG: ABC transporter ATP-binding protein [Polyangiaceae bacterium]